MRKYKYLLFDNDGTLMDFDAAQEKAFKNTYLSSGFSKPYSLDMLKKYQQANNNWWKKLELGECTKEQLQIGRFEEFLMSTNLKANSAEMNFLYSNFLSNGRDLICDAVHVLSRLSTKYKIIIITNGIAKTQYSRINFSKLKPFIHGIYVSEQVGYPKPYTQYFDYVLKKEGINQKDQCLVIGDSLSSDILGANNSNLDCCWFNPDKKTNENFKVNYEITELKELLSILM